MIVTDEPEVLGFEGAELLDEVAVVFPRNDKIPPLMFRTLDEAEAEGRRLAYMPRIQIMAGSEASKLWRIRLAELLTDPEALRHYGITSTGEKATRLRIV
jgi:hypothetical protein